MMMVMTARIAHPATLYLIVKPGTESSAGMKYQVKFLVPTLTLLEETYYGAKKF